MSSLRKEAYVEDAEDDGSIEGVKSTRQYAVTAKHRANVSKAVERRPSPRRSGSSSTGDSLADSNSTSSLSSKGKDRARPSSKDAGRNREERERRKKEKKPKAPSPEIVSPLRREVRYDEGAKLSSDNHMRPPPPKHSVTQPIVQQRTAQRVTNAGESAYYGIQQPAPSSARPQARARPVSYSGGPSRPPISNHQPQWAPVHHHPTPSPLVCSYPPPYMAPPFTPVQYPPGFPTQPPASPGGYFEPALASPSTERLKQRFGSRPSSSMGFHGDRDRATATDIPRRSSVSRRRDDDARKMPPPSRPRSAMPQNGPYQPPPVHGPPARQSRPSSSHRRSVGFVDGQGFDDEDFMGGNFGLFSDQSPPVSYDRRLPPTRPRRGSVYDQPAYDVVPAGRKSRPSSMYSNEAFLAGSIDVTGDKYENAMRYQDNVSGGPAPRLTAENIKRAARQGKEGSNRSTRSSASRDDSEYKRSNTTGITRSSSGGNENMTIKVPGSTIIRAPGVEIECSQGGEITLSHLAPGSRTSSEMGSISYQLEDSRSRVNGKALPHRPRAPSQSESHSRGYAPSRTAYDPLTAGGYI